MKRIDYLIVGAGLSGAVLARLLTNAGKNCFIIDKREYIGGNCQTLKEHGIDVHQYGPHIFHTNEEWIWDFANKYNDFIPYQLNIKANYNDEVYSLPFNLNTFHELFGVKTPNEAKEILENEIVKFGKITNLEEQALSQVGKTVYEKLIKGYTEKQWGKPCNELSPEIIKRLPVRFSWNNNYYNDTYQGLPVGGYTLWIFNIIVGLEGEEYVDYKLNEDFVTNFNYWMEYADNVIYCGEPDRLMNYQLGQLEWRSLSFSHFTVENGDETDQGCPIMNYTSNDTEYTRIIDQKYLTPQYEERDKKIMTFEYPQDFVKGKTEAYYPINNEKNNSLYQRYVELIREKYPNIILAGRLGLYKYIDMDDAINEAFTIFKSLNI